MAFVLLQVRVSRYSILSLLRAQRQSHHQQVNCQSLRTLFPTRTLATNTSSDSQITRKIQTAMADEKKEQEMPWTGQDPLLEVDPEIKELIGREKKRQVLGLELIASEVGRDNSCNYC